MFSEILSGAIIAILLICLALAILIIAITVIGNASYFTKPYTEALENKQERIALYKTIALLSLLLLLCKYL